MISEKDLLLYGLSNNGQKILTHDGIFHADEVFSIALINFIYGDIEILRSRNREILRVGNSNPDIFVLDVGGIYNPDMLCFDHHQFAPESTESTVTLVFNFLFQDKGYKLRNAIFYNRLVKGLSEWDTGTHLHEINTSHLVVSQVISGFNRYDSGYDDTQFLKALNFAYEIVINELNTSEEIQKSEKIWKNGIIYKDNAIILSTFCPFWRKMQAEIVFPFVMQPSKGGWAVMSADIINHPLPQLRQSENLVLYSNQKFFILFATENAAFEYLKKCC
jgi:uncharacterized UPF0160 family protein